MKSARKNLRARRGERGFALIVAILALMLLTLLGLTLAATTSTELQIATNYRWSLQALYNAEAGIEAGKAILASLNWSSILPTPPRTAPAGLDWDGNTAPATKGGGTNAPFGRASRDFESWGCDLRGNGTGYGVVLDDNSAAAPYETKQQLYGWNLNGAVTLWIRRPVIVGMDGRFSDYDSDDVLVLTAEGVAPGTSGPLAPYQAVRTLEMLVMRANPNAPPGCGKMSGQIGSGSGGGGFGGCASLGPGGVPGAGGESDPNAK